MPGRLNQFQRTMLQWNELHPYNAVHVVRIPAAFDLARLAKAVNSTLEVHGLTGLTVDRERGTFDYRGGPVACEIKSIPGGERGYAAVGVEIERQLNTPFFPGEGFNPFRFFAAPEPAAFALGIVYFHAIADATAIVWLVRDIVAGYLNGGQVPRPFNLHPRYRDGLLARPGLLAGRIATLPALIRNTRSSSRLPYRDENNFRNGFLFCTLAPGSLAALITTAKAWELTLNDLFLALLLKSLAPLHPGRLGHAKRRKVSIGCVSSLRNESGVEDGQAFGLFLGSWLVTHELPEGISLMELAKDIRRQTLAIKQRKLYLGASVEMIMGRFLLPWFSKDRQKKFHRKSCPLWGGITNMNLNPLWEQPPGAPPVDYFRAVSTGPVTPLVLSVTTAGDNVNLGITYRTTVFSLLEIERVKGDFLEMLIKLKHST